MKKVISIILILFLFVPHIAFADENMVIWGARPGKAKLTAKVNGKTITINVTVE